MIGVKLLDHRSDYPELLRTLGFASAPQLLYAFGALPLGPGAPVLAVAITVLGLCAWVIAVRQALDTTTVRSVVICLLAQIPGLVLLALAVSVAPPA